MTVTWTIGHTDDGLALAAGLMNGISTAAPKFGALDSANLDLGATPIAGLHMVGSEITTYGGSPRATGVTSVITGPKARWVFTWVANGGTIELYGLGIMNALTYGVLYLYAKASERIDIADGYVLIVTIDELQTSVAAA